MRVRLLALAVAALSVLPGTDSASAAVRYERECSGKVDTACHTAYCGIFDCIVWDCHVYADPFGGHNTQTCVGQARPRDPVE